MTTTDPAALPVVPVKGDVDVCEVCLATYGPSFDPVIYRVWLKVHARPHEAPEVPDVG